MPDTFRVLYVDDDPGLLEIGKLFLEESGRFNVDIIISASAALALLNATKFDAIISDYQMPGMDGILFLKSVRASGNTIPFILFTGRGREEIVIQALNEGANFYLQKGGEPEAQFAELAHKIQIAVEHHRAAEKIQALNRLYSVLSATNKAIFRIQTKREFFFEICRILVETGGFRMAWIGLADLEQKIIRPVVSSGYVDGYLDSINISTEDIPQGRGPTGTAFREGKYFWSNDITQDPRMEPWRENALKRGYLANAAFAFALGTKNAGVLSVYAPVTGFFDGPIIDLLEELAIDISFYLRTIDDQNERILAINARRLSEERFHGLFDTINSGVAIYEVRNEGKSGKDYIIKDFNKIALEIEGKKKDEVIGKSLFDLRPTIDEYGLIPVFQQVWKTGVPAYFPQKIYIDEKYSSWYENRVFRLLNGEIVAVYDDVTERKRAEADLQESEEALSAILNGITESAFLMTPEGIVIAANETVARRLGMKQADDLVGQNAFKLLPEDVQMSRHIKIREVIQSGQPAHFEDVREGRVISQTIYPVKDPDGTIRRLSIFGIDVTDRKLTEETLYETEARLRFALRSAKSGTWDWDFISGKLEWSTEFFELFGLPPDVPPSFETWLATLHPDDRKQSMDKIDQSVKDHKDLWNEFRVLHPEGGLRWIGAAGSTCYNDNGEPLRMSGLCIDISERKLAEEALRESEERFRAILDATPFPIALVDVQDNNIEFWSQSALTRFGHTANTTPEWYQIAYPDPDYRRDVINRWKPFLEKAKQSHQPVNTGEYRVTCRDGSVRICELYATFLADKLIVTFNDITERKQAEEALLKKSEELYAVNEELTASEEELRQNMVELAGQEQALHESKRELADIIEFLPDATFVIDRKGIVIAWNRAIEEMTAISKDEMIGQGDHAYTIPFYGERRSQLLDLIDLDDEELQSKYQYVKRKGSTLYAEVFTPALYEGRGAYVWATGSPLFNIKGERIGAIESIRDITERKKADQALHESEKKYRDIFEQSVTGLFKTAPGGRLIEANVALARMYGYPGVEEMLQAGISVGQLYANQEDREEVLHILAEKGIVENYETLHCKRDGTNFWVSITARTIRDADGAVLFYEGTNIDITERKLSEDALRESEEKYRVLLDESLDPVFSFYPDGTYRYVNRAFAIGVGKPVDKIIGKKIWDVFDKEEAEKRFSALRMVFATGDEKTIEVRVPHPGGDRYYVTTIVPVKDENGSVVTAICSSKDITPRKLAEEALCLANKKLNLLSGITRHDINNQLLALNGFLKLLHNKAQDPTLEDYFTRIKRSSDRISTMILFTREYEEIGVHAPVWQEVRTLVDLAAKDAPLGKIMVKNNLPAGHEVLADPLVVKVFYNLMDNAIRYGGKITTIGFSILESGDVHLIVCEDDGEGIPADEKEKIFERGFGKTTGMGLALSKEILDITGITIKETGEPGKGARFEMTVPKGMWRYAETGEKLPEK